MVSNKLISGAWYHGDRQKLTTFKDRQMDTEDYVRNRNAVGPGIYWTRLKWQASGYAENDGYIYTAEMDLDPKRVLDKRVKPDDEKLRQFIELAPDKEHRDMSLQDWNEDIETAIEMMVDDGMNDVSLHEALIGIYNSLYGRDSKAFGSAMVALGYDAYLHKLPQVYHLIVYNTDIIKIKDVSKKKKHIKDLHDF